MRPASAARWADATAPDRRPRPLRVLVRVLVGTAACLASTLVVTIVVLFSRALRLRDHPALATAARRGDRVVPLFVVDPRIFHASDRSPNRSAFLGETLADLRQQLRQLGADLVLRAGDTVSETMAVATTVGAEAVYFTHDVTGFAVRRARHLREAALTVGIEVLGHPGVSVLEPGAVRPQGGGDHFKVFTPYWRHWSQAERRPVAAAPGTLVLPAGIDVGGEVEEVVPAWAWAGASPERAIGGEGAAQRRLSQWRHAGGPNGYADNHDRLAADLTSRLSPYLHFGCLSALELARSLEVEVEASQSPGVQALLRQLCWRDFYHQVTAAFPAIASRDYRPGPAADSARPDADTSADTPTAATAAGQDGLVQAWKDGRTGYPVVDAGMRQLRGRGLDAQSGSAHHRFVPGQGPGGRLAGGGRPFPLLAQRRGCGPELGQLAVDGRHRQRHQTEPHAQPPSPG